MDKDILGKRIGTGADSKCGVQRAPPPMTH